MPFNDTAQTPPVRVESTKLAAGVTLLSPFVPLLFMGEEYGEKRPFQYFTSHGDAALIEAVRRGRRAEFAQFGWGDEVADPQDEATFAASVLDHAAKDERGWGYAVFGAVTEGMDVVDKIKAVKTSAAGPFAKDAPVEPIVITSVRRR